MKTLVTALLLAGATCLPFTGQVAAQDGLETTDITIGLPVHTSTFLPLYLAEAEGYFEEAGLDVELVAFRGGSDLVRGMIAGAVQIGCTSLAGVTVGIKAGQPIKAFYGGFNMAIFDWYAVEGIESIADTKGKRFGVTRIGSSTDFLTRYALSQNGLDPDSDVQIVQGGGSPERFAAMEAGQLDVNIFAPAENFIAADAGYNLILRQTDIAPDYPFHVFFAMEDFIEENPNTLTAFLKAYVKGVRLAKADKDRAVKELMEREGYTEEYAARTYDLIIDQIREDGQLPSEAGMDAFWGIGMQAGEYEEPWEQGRWWLSTYVDSYDEWKPAE
jgi:NitT/TauT family transport system substrate-binding protein